MKHHRNSDTKTAKYVGHVAAMSISGKKNFKYLLLSIEPPGTQDNVSCRKLHSLVVYLYVNGSGSITSVGEERANLSAVVYL